MLKAQVATIAALLPVLVLVHALYAQDRDVVELQPYYRSITLTGFTYPRQEITISSEVSGRCEAIYADIGDEIPENGVLAEIDTTFIKLDIEANRVNQEKARRQLAQEEKTLARFTSLRRRESAPQAQLDEAELAADLNRIEIKKLQNEAKRLQEKLVRHKITAPVGWLVIERFIEPGELVQEGKAVARLGDFRQLLIPFAVSYTELLAIMATSPLNVELPDLAATIPAMIYRTSPVFDPRTRKIQVELLLVDSGAAPGKKNQDMIRGGMRGLIRFRSRDKSNSFILPASALVNRYESQWLVKPDGTMIQVILIGMEADGNRAIISGETLRAGQKYLADPTSEAALR